MTAPSPHFEALLEHDSDLIRAKVLEMGALDAQALTGAFHAFLRRDRQLAYSVILRDQEVDALETELDRLCLEFILRHQPAAGHLRFVYSASKVVNDLERVGDYAESIARMVVRICALDFEVPTDKFGEMANLAIPMLHDSVRAFVTRNPELARTTMAAERRVNQVRDSLNADLVGWRQENRLPLEALPPLLTIARRFERVSDQATNICEEALYVATGEYQRHAPCEGFRVLFVDDTNGCLSRMAEAIGNALAARRFAFASAGMAAGPVDAVTIQFLKDKGLSASERASQSVDQIPERERLQVVVALSKGAESARAQRPTKSVGFDWLVPDPSKVQGTPEEVRAAYDRAYEFLTNQIRDLTLAILGNDRHPTDEQTNA